MLFEKTKNNLKRNKFIKLLAAVVAAGTNGMFMVKKDAEELYAADNSFVEINPAINDPKDAAKIAIRATAAGVTASQADTAAKAAQPPAAPAEKPSYTIEDAVALPESKRGGVKADIYPFAQLQVGQSFFVPATEKRKDPAKSLASTVSSATRRYKNTDRRRFVVRPVKDANGVITGARIWRTENAPAAAPAAPATPAATPYSGPERRGNGATA